MFVSQFLFPHSSLLILYSSLLILNTLLFLNNAIYSDNNVGFVYAQDSDTLGAAAHNADGCNL